MLRSRIIYWASILQSFIRDDENIGYYVLSYPKSGSNWLCNMLSDYFDIPVLEVWKERFPVFSRRIYHMHRIIPVKRKDSRCVYLVRDGRDVVVSYFFQMARSPDAEQMRLDFEKFCGKKVEESRVVDDLPDFIEFLEQYKRASVNYRTHIETALKHNYVRVKFEELKENPEAALARVIGELTGNSVDKSKIAISVRKNSFDKVRTNENSYFVRKGVHGDWVNYFRRDAAEKFWRYYAKAMVLMGYECNDEWIDNVSR